MKLIVALAAVTTLASRAPAQTARGDVNYPTVQSGQYGTWYVRTVPAADTGTAGLTQVFRVGKDRDTIVDQYPVYMRGELLLGWSPQIGKWCLIHMEPMRLTNHMDPNHGRLSRLVFYAGGQEIMSYSMEALRALGLEDKVITLEYRNPGQFMVDGITQIPNTNDYVLSIRKVERNGSVAALTLDITTGKPFVRR